MVQKTTGIKIGLIIALPLVIASGTALRQRSIQAAIDAEGEISISARESSFSLGEPIALSILLKNKSQEAAYVEWLYPYLDFTCEADNAATQVLVQAQPPTAFIQNGPTDYLKIDGNSEFKFDVYLNRYVKFLAPGVVTLNCKINIPLQHKRSDGNIPSAPDFILTQEKEVTFKVEKPDPRKLETKLRFLMNTKSNPGRRVGKLASEALRFSPPHAVLKVLPEMLRTKSIGPEDAIELAAQSPSLEATKIIESTLPSKDFRVVDAALTALEKRKVVLRNDGYSSE